MDISHAKEEITLTYQQSVDMDMYFFIKDVENNRDIKPITVGYLSEEKRSLINNNLNKNILFAISLKGMEKTDLLHRILH